LLGRPARVGAWAAAPRAEQDVGRLEVAVDHPLAMGVLDRSRQRRHDLGPFVGRLWHPSEPARQVLPLDQFQGQIRAARVLADVVDLDDVGVP
jgi:hypothetical protein